MPCSVIQEVHVLWSRVPDAPYFAKSGISFFELLDEPIPIPTKIWYGWSIMYFSPIIDNSPRCLLASSKLSLVSNTLSYSKSY